MPPTVTINQNAGQGDPSGTSPVVFDVVFMAVTGFDANDIIQPDGGRDQRNAERDGCVDYAVSVSGMTAANGSPLSGQGGDRAGPQRRLHQHRPQRDF